MRRKSLHFVLVCAALATILPLACATSVDHQNDSTGGGGEGGGGGDVASTSASTGGGPCVFAEECASFTDTCAIGACVNSECKKMPIPEKEGVPCDDGKTCTLNDACSKGFCTGAMKSCPSSDTCHVGQCDLETDQCVEVPGNNGLACANDDPCSEGVCKDGACAPGKPTDCSFLNGPCTVGYCDPGVGCMSMPANDGTKCDDGLFCTISDTCQAGKCGGQPNPCAAPGDACMVGVCNENKDACSAVPGNNGGACDDGNLCTSGETCSNGACGGGAPGNNGGACDDGSACTTNDVCQNGGCAGTPLAVCQNGDGCCPAGCTLAADNDCGGVVYMTSANGSPGFYGYDIGTNSWSILPSPPVPTHSQLTTDGKNVLMMGDDGVIYSFFPPAGQWLQISKGPGPEVSLPIGFFKWTPAGFYYANDGGTALRYSNGNGSWSTVNLPLQASCAGSFDPQTGKLYIRAFGSLGLMVFSTATNTVTQTWSNGTSVGENSRTGSYYGGFFYAREGNQPFDKIDVATGSAVSTGISPLESFTATDVNSSNGDLYIGPFLPSGTAFQVWNVITNTLTTLAPAPVAVPNHSTIVVLKK